MGEISLKKTKGDFTPNDGVEIEDSVKYTVMYDENLFLTGSIKQLKEHIDDLFTKYDPSKNIEFVIIM